MTRDECLVQQRKIQRRDQTVPLGMGSARDAQVDSREISQSLICFVRIFGVVSNSGSFDSSVGQEVATFGLFCMM